MNPHGLNGAAPARPLLIHAGYAWVALQSQSRREPRDPVTRAVRVPRAGGAGATLGDVEAWPFNAAATRATPTLALIRVTRQARDLGAFAYPEAGARQLPAAHAECPPPETCAFVSCKHHTALDVDARTGSIHYVAPLLGHGADGVPELDLDALPHRCALAAAARGGMTLEEVAGVIGVTRERARQIESAALARVRKRWREDQLETPAETPAHWSDG